MTQYITLPGTDLRISRIGMGCWAIGGKWWGEPVATDVAVRAIHSALDSGINWLDTAPLYGHGRADEIVAKAIESYSGGEDVIVATKVGINWQGDHAESLLTADRITRDIDASLQRLKVDTIDLLQVHWPCQSNTPLEETCEALNAAKKAGKVRYLGLCNYNARGLKLAASLCDVRTLQTPYSVMRREFERELLPAVNELADVRDRVSVLAYEPLCRGLLTGKFHSLSAFPDSDLRARDDRFKGTRYLSALAVISRAKLLLKKWELPMAPVVLAWTIRREGIDALIAGAKTAEQVTENALALQIAQREDLNWEELDRIFNTFRG